MADKKIFGTPETWHQKVPDFLAENDNQSLTETLINTPALDLPLTEVGKLRDMQIKLDEERALKKDLKQIKENPVDYIQGKLDLYNSEPVETNLNNFKKNINTARAMGIIPGPNKNKPQGKKKTTWQIMLEASGPGEKNEYKKILNKEYYKRGTKNLSDYELRFIGKHPSQLSPKVEEVKPVVKPVVVPQEPLEVIIKRKADENLKRQQEAYDRQFGTTGIVSLRRPI